MLVEKLDGYRDRIVAEFRKAFEEDHTAHQVAVSFAVGVFVTAMPTLGTGLLVLAFLAATVAWMSKVALFIAVLILNPLIKPFVYVASFWLGEMLFGDEAVAPFGVTSLDWFVNILRSLILGNLVIALFLAFVSYFAALFVVTQYRRREYEVVEKVADEVVEALEEDG